MHRNLWIIVIFVAIAACDSGTSHGEGSGNAGLQIGPNQLVVEPVVLHRLNNLEYDNTVHDLLGTSLTPATTFPPDPTTNGFDNMASSLSLTPALFSLYSQSAQALANDALDLKPRSSEQIPAASYGTSANGFPFSSSWSVTGTLSVPFKQAQNDTVAIAITAGGSAVSAPTPIMAVTLDGKALQNVTVTAPAGDMAVYTLKETVAAGNHTLGLAITNYQKSSATAGTGNQLIVDSVGIASTTLIPSSGRAMVYACDPNATQDSSADCWRTNVLTLAQRAWRRPLTSAEQTALLAVWQSLSSGGANDAAFKGVIQALLVSSEFLFRPSDAELGQSGTSVAIDDYALANRLSYFLWASMPDSQLMTDAAQGLLRTDAGLRAEVTRMLADPKAAGLETGFAAQWLNTRGLATVAPDPTVFPSWNPNLIPAMTAEAQMVFADFVNNGRPLGQMFTPGFSYLNDTLATHYGLTPPGSSTPVKVQLPQLQRGGLLSLGAMLVSTSQPDRTSPVERGLWILEQLMCIDLAPPPNVPPLPPSVGNSNVVITMRAEMAAHLTNPACSSCHNIIDPLGFGLEEYDGVGAFRTIEAGAPVNTTGNFPDGTTFNNAAQMAQTLQTMPTFTQCLANRMYSYALGRNVTNNDSAILQSINSDVATSGSMQSLITAIVLSPGFRLVNTTGAQ